MADTDPAITEPDLYKVIFENDRVRVLDYRDTPGTKTHPHRHPDSVMVTLSSFQRRVSSGGQHVDVDLLSGQVRWVGAQEHSGENIGTTDSHSVFIELKEPNPALPSTPDMPLGPSAG